MAMYRIERRNIGDKPYIYTKDIESIAEFAWNGEYVEYLDGSFKVEYNEGLYVLICTPIALGGNDEQEG